MTDRLKGKRAVVTAAAAGIGRACAIAFAREGATVIATDINEAGIASLGKEGVAETAKLDVRNTAETPSMLDRAAAQGPRVKEMFISRQKMGRLGTAEEIAAMAVYLGSDESAFTTGVDMVVDGGFML